MKKISMKFMVLAIIFTIGFFSCSEKEDSHADTDDLSIRQYLDQHGIVAGKETHGVYYEKLSENESGQKVETGKVVALRYKISTLEGDILEDLIAKDTSVLALHSQGAIFPAGLDVALALMKTHEKYRFYIPAYLTYDDYSNGSYFSEYTNFIVEAIVDSVFSETDLFEAEQDSIENYLAKNQISFEKFASGLYYSEVTKGTGDSPLNGYNVKVHLTRKDLAGKVLFTTAGDDPASFIVGAINVVQGLSEGIKQMREGGKAVLFLPSKIAFGASFRVLPSGLLNDLYEEGFFPFTTNVPPYEPLIYEVELLDVY